MPTTRPGKILQEICLEPRQADAALIVGLESSLRSGYRGSLFGPQAQDRGAIAQTKQPGHLRPDRLQGFGIGRHQDDVPLGAAGTLQHLASRLQGQIGALGAPHRQEGRFQVRNLGGDGCGVPGQGGDDEGLGAIGQQGGLALGGSGEKIEDLVTRARQTRGRQILGIHVWGKVEDNDTLGLGLEKGLRQPLPYRTRQGGHPQEPAQGQQDPRQATTPGTLFHQQMRQEVGIHQTSPGLGPGVDPSQPPEQPGQGQQGQKPEGTQKMEIERHLRNPLG